MAKTGIEIKRDAITERLNGMLNRAQSNQGAFSRMYSLYQSLQTKRFQSENASEGASWEPLKSSYAASKLKKLSSSPGGGRKVLIATSTLAGSVIGPGSPFQGVDRHRAQFTSHSMIIRVEETGTNAAGHPFTYPRFVNSKRSFMSFGDRSINRMKYELHQYILEGSRWPLTA